LGQAEAAFRGQFSSSGKHASAVVHPICVAWRLPIAIFSGFSMAKTFVLNSAANNAAEARKNKNRKACLLVRTMFGPFRGHKRNLR